MYRPLLLVERLLVFGVDTERVIRDANVDLVAIESGHVDGRDELVVPIDEIDRHRSELRGPPFRRSARMPHPGVVELVAHTFEEPF